MALRHNPLEGNINSSSGLAREKRVIGLPGLYGFWKCGEGIYKPGDALTAGVAAAVFAGLAGYLFFGKIAAAIPSVLLGLIFVPRVYGAYRVSLWRMAMVKSLPRGTFSLLVSLRSGMSTSNALEVAASSTPHPLGYEFLAMAREIKSGKGEERAAEDFGRRLMVREGRVLGNVLARFIRLGGGPDALELLEMVQGMLRNREIVRAAVRAGMADILGDATLALIVTMFFFALGYFLAPDIYSDALARSHGRMIILGGLFQAVLVQAWVRWKCKRMEEELV